ncbi:DNA polymerase III subunit alpha [Natranaerobius trueperi]|uniref:DNA polymerase III subunit alpha n=1 Tax=Natranaerobius trueperi TaxID=759412 RepID=A0A226C0J5_9FIRM|nr:DNA polymerase III subunit alpha [Natranaerobius trueperi]OWZ84695.1 DNA polymerase III subunit alpha [Natranaerobius trueperi]
MPKPFVHLHNHSHHSLLDGKCRIEDLVEKAKQLDMPALALTDHGVMYGVVEFYKKAKEAGIKPILGCEVYVAPRSRFDKDPAKDKEQYHLVLLARNQTGYKNLMKLVSLAYQEGFYYKPRVDYELLEQYSEGIIALSACLGGEIPSLILQGQYQKAKDKANKLKEIFGPHNFYLELQDHGLIEERKVNTHLLELSRELSIELVATNDIHYINKEDATIHDVLLCIQTGKKVSDDDRMKFPNEEFYMKDGDNMNQLFSEFPRAIENTLKIADKCNVELDFDTLHLPYFEVPKDHDENSYLRELCMKGLNKRYQDITPEIRERLEYELDIIQRMGYASYFLIVWDFVRFAHENNILVGPGRGSAAGSLVAYCLEITNIDPIRYGLLFERFLNPERVNMPDIDIDFCYEKREQVIDYVVKKYGSDKVAQIITFGTMQARAAVRDVGRVLGMGYGDVDKVAKMIPHELGITIDKALELNKDLKNLYQEDPQVKRLLDISKSIEGLHRHASTHAAGIVIAKEPLTEYVPLQSNEGQIMTQLPMGTLEELGLLKMDFLGLKTLTMMNRAVGIIEKTTGKPIKLDEISLDDNTTYELIRSGNTLGIFQLESSGMRNVLKELKPTSFEDIIATSALYRPGPMEQIPTFIESKHGKREISYPHPDLKSILEETYGIMVYQEQIMQVASEMAGFSLGEADLLRRAIGKKKKDILNEQKVKFVEGCVNKGYDRKVGEHVYNLIVKFADYGFNKSHSAAYAYIAYQSAYLKANYPTQFMAALLTNSMNDTEKLALYIDDANSQGIEILPPDINESLVDFTVVSDKRIRFGLAAIKNVGRAAVHEIIKSKYKNGGFNSFDEFCSQIDLRVCNRKVIESLVKVGAFDELGYNRKQLLQVVDEAIKKAQMFSKSSNNGQVTMWEIVSDGLPKIEVNYPNVTEFNLKDRLDMEKELLGFYVSGHPLDDYKKKMQSFHTVPINKLVELQDGAQIYVGGIPYGIKEILTKKGQKMAFCSLEDQTGSVELVIFPNQYGLARPLLYDSQPLLIKGKLDKKEEGETKLIVQQINSLSQVELPKKKIYIKVLKTKNPQLEKLKHLLIEQKSDLPVLLYFPENKKLVEVDPSCYASDNQEFIKQVEKLMGEGSIKVKIKEGTK